MKLCYVCSIKLVRRKTFLNSFKTLRIERNYYSVLDTEYIRVTIQEQRLLNQLQMKFSKLLVKNLQLKLLLNQKESPYLMNTSLKESYILMLISIVVLFTKRWVSQLICSQFYLQFQELQDGWLTGMNLLLTLKTRQ